MPQAHAVIEYRGHAIRPTWIPAQQEGERLVFIVTTAGSEQNVFPGASFESEAAAKAEIDKMLGPA